MICCKWSHVSTEPWVHWRYNACQLKKWYCFNQGLIECQYIWGYLTKHMFTLQLKDLRDTFCCVFIIACQRYGYKHYVISSPDQSSCQETWLERYKLPGRYQVVVKCDKEEDLLSLFIHCGLMCRFSTRINQLWLDIDKLFKQVIWYICWALMDWYPIYRDHPKQYSLVSKVSIELQILPLLCYEICYA